MNESQVIAAMTALSQNTRLRILRYLVVRGPQGATAGEISETVKATSSRASFHLASLSRAGLISAKRNSRNIIYKVNFQAMGDLVNYLVDDCCQNNATVVACCAPIASD